MYAIVDIAGQQFKVSKDQKVFVHRLEGAEGTAVDFTNVLLIDNADKVTVGSPLIEGAMVSAKIIAHVRGDKVLVFKKKRRKGYQKLNGHRQDLTQILIEEIVEKGAKPRPVEKAKATPVTEEVVASAEPKVKPAPKAAKPKAASPQEEVKKSKPAAEKNPAVKKAAATEKKAAAPKKAAPAKKTNPKAE